MTHQEHMPIKAGALPTPMHTNLRKPQIEDIEVTDNKGNTDDAPLVGTTSPKPRTAGDKDTDTTDRKKARTALSPEFGALTALKTIQKKNCVGDSVTVDALLDELMAATRDESATGTDRLLAQATVLDQLFSHLTTIAMQQEYISQLTTPLTLALRAQAQCRATLQAVSDIRHPRQYIGQQNVTEQYNAGGHQQVNRDVHADRKPIPPTELSEGIDHELHTNRSTPPSGQRASAQSETVGTRDRTTNT